MNTKELFEKFLTTSPTPDAVLQWVQDHLLPEDVFSTTALDRWAESEGYTKNDGPNSDQ